MIFIINSQMKKNLLLFITANQLMNIQNSVCECENILIFQYPSSWKWYPRLLPSPLSHSHTVAGRKPSRVKSGYPNANALVLAFGRIQYFCGTYWILLTLYPQRVCAFSTSEAKRDSSISGSWDMIQMYLRLGTPITVYSYSFPTSSTR